MDSRSQLVLLSQGVLVEWLRHGQGIQTAPGPHDKKIMLVKGGIELGIDHVKPDIWPSNDTWATYGGDGDLWGVSLTTNDVNSLGFGAALSVRSAGLGLAYVDSCRITIFTGNYANLFSDTWYATQRY